MKLEFQRGQISQEQFRAFYEADVARPIDAEMVRTFSENHIERLDAYRKFLQAIIYTANEIRRDKNRDCEPDVEKHLAAIRTPMPLWREQVGAVSELMDRVRVARWGSVATCGGQSASNAHSLVTRMMLLAADYWTGTKTIATESQTDPAYAYSTTASELFVKTMIPTLPKPQELAALVYQERAAALEALEGGRIAKGRSTASEPPPVEGLAVESAPAASHIPTPRVERWVVILTALDIETKAVLPHLVECSSRTHNRGTIYFTGMCDGKDGPWRVAVAEIGMGNVRAAIHAERAIAEFSPKLAMFVGVAGGLKDVRLGDVVAASKVVGYEGGKAAEVFKSRPDVGNTSHRLEQRARYEVHRGDWLKRIKAATGGPASDRNPVAKVGPIAAGEKVVTSRASPTGAVIDQIASDALAVEMEGSGFLSAAHACEGLPAIVIRGISDLVEKKTESDAAGWQPKAAAHAAAFAFQLLAALDND
jgi:nucleoside phosphorylase